MIVYRERLGQCAQLYEMKFTESKMTFTQRKPECLEFEIEIVHIYMYIALVCISIFYTYNILPKHIPTLFVHIVCGPSSLKIYKV